MDLGTSDVRRVEIWRVSSLAFYFRMQTLCAVLFQQIKRASRRSRHKVLPKLKANLGLGWEESQQAVIDEVLCMVTGYDLGTDVGLCH